MKAAFFLICFSISLSGMALDTPNAIGSVAFSYDPVFWKETLHLSNQQLISIEHINADFYSSVKTIAGQAKENRRELLNEFLLDRNTRIWNVFSRRQQMKWRRITVKLASH